MKAIEQRDSIQSERIRELKEEMKALTQRWTKLAAKKLIGKKITNVEYMPTDECVNMGWYNRPICIELDNKVWIYPQSDDEGNDGGVIYYTGVDIDDAEVLPVLGLEYRNDEV